MLEKSMTTSVKTCAFTGHRPHKFPWGYNEDDQRCRELKAVLTRLLTRLARAGVTDFYSGMADGSDLWLSQIVLSLEAEYPLRLHCILPCPDQAERWPAPARARYGAVLERASSVEVVSPRYQEGCMLERNRRLVEAAELLTAVYNGESRGGTAATVRYAQRLGRRIILVDPLSRRLYYSGGQSGDFPDRGR